MGRYRARLAGDEKVAVADMLERLDRDRDGWLGRLLRPASASQEASESSNRPQQHTLAGRNK